MPSSSPISLTTRRRLVLPTRSRGLVVATKGRASRADRNCFARPATVPTSTSCSRLIVCATAQLVATVDEHPHHHVCIDLDLDEVRATPTLPGQPQTSHPETYMRFRSSRRVGLNRDCDGAATGVTEQRPNCGNEFGSRSSSVSLRRRFTASRAVRAPADRHFAKLPRFDSRRVHLTIDAAIAAWTYCSGSPGRCEVSGLDAGALFDFRILFARTSKRVQDPTRLGIDSKTVIAAGSPL